MRSVPVGLFALMLPLAAAAQDSGDDWDFGTDPARRLTMAAVSFENFGVAVRCLDGTLGVVASGLPPGPQVRTLALRIGDAAEGPSTWVSHRSGETAFALWPARMAAEMSKGGVLSLGVPDDGVVRRIVVDLPSSSQAIGRVFDACDRVLSPEPTPDLPGGTELAGLVWSNVPQPRFPPETRSEAGIAALSCRTTDDGHLRSCRIESEFPEGGGFGRAATLGAHRTGRVRMADGSTGGMEGRRLAFTVRYNMSEEPPLPLLPSRIRRDPPATSSPLPGS